MKKIFITFFAVILLYGCSNDEYEAGISDKLQKWDALLWERNYEPEDSLAHLIFDSLKTIGSTNLSMKTKAYYNLIYTFIGDKTDITFTDDSIIAESVYIYRKTDDYYNYARALLYDGIVKCRIDQKDTSIATVLKEAEFIKDRYIENPDYKFSLLLYSYLGNIYFDSNHLDAALTYHRKAISLSEQIHDTNNIILEKCEIAWILLRKKDYRSAYELLSSTGNSDNLTPILKYKLNNAYSGYYSAVSDTEKYIEHTRNNLYSPLGKNNISLLYSMANGYYSLGIKDSTVKYLELLVKNISPATPNGYRYYHNISNKYSSLGMIEESIEYMDSSYHYLQKEIKNLSDNKIIELEKKYDNLETTLELQYAKNQKNLLIFALVIALLLLFVLLLFLRKNQKERRLTNEKNRIVEMVNQLLLLSNDTMASYRKLIEKENKSRDTDDYIETYRQIKKEIKSLDDKYKEKIQKIVDIDIEGYDGLTGLQKAIVLLQKENYNTSKIASILNTSQDSIRVLSSKIKAKKRK